MENNTLISYPAGCTDLGHNIRFFCLPNRAVCRPTQLNSLLTDCSERWNCPKKIGGLREMPGDVPYFFPVPDGEKFMLQTALFDEGSTDRTNPNTGFSDWLNIQLCDKDGNVVIDTSVTSMSDISDRYYNAWNGKNSYQVVEIDTSKFTTDCWHLKFKTTGGVEVCTHDMKRISECSNLVSLESTFGDGSEDCFNNYYGTPTLFNGTGAFGYSNKVWVRAILRFDGGENETRRFADTVAGVDADDNYILHSGEKIPPYMMHHIKGAIFTGQKVLIDGVEYSYENVQFKRQVKSQMFKYDIPVYRPCSVEHGCT